jgi:hypothetical protein
MSPRLVFFALLAGLALVACGPSSAQIKTARTARYHSTASATFQAAVSALASNDYKVAAADPVSGKARTVDRWYEYDGTYVAKDSQDQIVTKDKMIDLTIQVAVVADGDAFRVEVTPYAMQFRDGYSQLTELKPDDPAMSGWISGKVDNIYISIYDALKKDAVAAGT